MKTKVNIVSIPVKFGYFAQRLYIESHPPLPELLSQGAGKIEDAMLEFLNLSEDEMPILPNGSNATIPKAHGIPTEIGPILSL